MLITIWHRIKLNSRRAITIIIFFICSTLISRPLTILFIVGHFPAPSQTFILNQMTRLIERGHNVLIYSFHYDSYHHLHPDIIKYGLLDHLIFDPFSGNLPECDIVLCQFGYLGKKIAESTRLQRWLQGKKIVTCLRGSDLSCRIKKDPFLYATLFKKGDLFLPVCDYFKRRLIKLGCNVDRIAVHYSAIDCAKFHFKERMLPQQGPINVISVSRLVEKKGLAFAIRAMAKVIRMNPRVRFKIVGDGPERNNLRKIIQQAHMQDKIILCGWKTQDEVVKLLKEAHIFLLPSITAADGNEEGIANALKEAMAMGLPVISTFHAGNTELIQDGISGYLVPQKNVTALYNKIMYVIKHSHEWARISRNARETIEKRFEIKKNIKKLEKLFYELLNKQ